MRRALIALFALLALPAASCGKPAGQAAGGDQIRAYILAHPEVIEEAISKLQEKRQAAADSQLKQQLVANRSKMENDPRDFVAGNPNGKVTVVEFFDYRCPYCIAALPGLNKLIADNKDVRLVLKEFPILSPISETAARAAFAAKQQGKYWQVHQALLQTKNLDGAAIDKVLSDNGVDVQAAHTYGADKPTTAYLEENHALARSTGVTGTPAFIIGDKMIAGWSPDEIQAQIDAVRKKG